MTPSYHSTDVGPGGRRSAGRHRGQRVRRRRVAIERTTPLPRRWEAPHFAAGPAAAGTSSARTVGRRPCAGHPTGAGSGSAHLPRRRRAEHAGRWNRGWTGETCFKRPAGRWQVRRSGRGVGQDRPARAGEREPRCGSRPSQSVRTPRSLGPPASHPDVFPPPGPPLPNPVSPGPGRSPRGAARTRVRRPSTKWRERRCQRVDGDRGPRVDVIVGRIRGSRPNVVRDKAAGRMWPVRRAPVHVGSRPTTATSRAR